MEEIKKRRILTNIFAEFCLRPALKRAVLAYFEHPDAAVLATDAEWQDFFALGACLGITEEEKKRIGAVRRSDYEKRYDLLRAKEIHLVTAEEEAFPKTLLPHYDAPEWLYYKGNLPTEEVALAVVGARKCTPYGSETAKGLAAKLSERGIGILSGLAYGVDKAAHEGALFAGGKTYAVLGCGVDVCYPAAHRNTYERILATGGGIISEYPPGTRPLSCLFPQRNRIIAGLSDGIVVTEAKKKSGSLITVSLGLEYGKNIYAVPGRVTDVVSEGCNYLIKEGAKPIFSAEDILEDFEEKLPKKDSSKSKKNCINYEIFKNTLASEEKMVYASLRLRSKHIEEIQTETKLSPEVLAGVLCTLCERGYIKRYGQAYYALNGDYTTFFSER